MPLLGVIIIIIIALRASRRIRPHWVSYCFLFGGKVKKTAWDVWKVFPGLTNLLLRLVLMSEKVDDAFMTVIEGLLSSYMTE